TIIQDLVKNEELDPWNIDISKLTRRYMETLKKLHEHNFFVSGKMLLASALLLKIKSDRLVHGDLAAFDQQLFPQDDALLDTENDYVQPVLGPHEIPQLLIKTPQPRKRQLTLQDLMKALEKALEVDERRTLKRLQDDVVFGEATLPEKIYDITEIIKDVYEKIRYILSHKPSLTFDELVSSDKKEDKIMTFIPLLHLDSQQKIDLQQDVPFGTIHITLGGS
ncbi:segregation/condensation protein A, partial [Candidatus Woesearchaeota archaeon]|nr:segregation/condensation protein A [Candidatus Woesearchaeota archaeon]